MRNKMKSAEAFGEGGKNKIFSSKIIYFLIFLFVICFTCWGIKNVGAAPPDEGTTIQMEKHLDMGTPGGRLKIINLGTPEENYDATTKSYVDSIAVGTSDIGLWRDTGTYIYNANSGNIGMATVSGSVGIGTANPSVFKLQMGGSIGPYLTGSYNLGSSALKWGTVYADAFSGSLSGTANASNVSGGVGASSAFGANTGYGDYGFYADASNPILYIDDTGSTGNVGIGTAVPVAKLEVSGGDAKISGGNYGLVANNGYYMITQANSTTLQVGSGSGWSSGITFVPAGNEAMRILQNGNVGIGTIVPSTPLHIKSTSSPQLKIEYDAGRYVTIDHAGDITNNDNSGANPITFTTGGSGVGDHDIVFVPEGAEAMRIKAGGNVGIGTTIPGARLHTYGDQADGIIIERSSSSGSNLRFKNTSGTFYAGMDASENFGIGPNLDVGSSPWLYIKSSDGNVGIGTTIPEGKLSVVGDVGIGAMVNTDQASHMLDIASTKGSTGFSAIRALYPSGGGLAGTEFGALANRDSEWKAVYAKAGTGGAIALYTDGEVNMMSGNVGIGTTVPEGLLHLATNSGAAVIYDDAYSDLNSRRIQLKIRKSHTTTIGSKVETTTGEDLGGIEFQGVDNTSAFDWGANIYAVQDGASGTRVPTNLVFTTYSATAANNNQLVLHNDGNVGIGTASPSTNLDINGQIKIQGGSPGANKILTSDSVGLATWSPATSISDGDWTISGNDQYSAVSGNVGIGVTAPVYKLSVVESAANALKIPQIIRQSDTDNSGSSVGLGFAVNDVEIAKSAVIYERTATYGLGKLHFALSSTADNTTAVTLANAKMTIQNDGKVGIGTTIPGFNLDVYGSGVVESQIMSTNNYAAQYIKGGQSGDVRWGLFSGYPNAGDFTIRETGVANYLTVKKTTGYIGIGTTSPQNGLQINGTRNGSYQGQLLVVGNSDHAYIQIQSTAPTTKETGLQIVGDGTISAPRWTIKNPANSSDLQFSTTGTGGNALRILSTGNVGIGVTDPGNPLTVRAPGAAQKTLLTLGTDTTGYGVGYEQSIDFKWYNDSSINGRISGYESYLGGVGSGGLKFYTSQYTNPGLNTTPSMTLDSAGNVGIGTTSMGAFYEKAYILQAGSLTTSLGHPRGLGLVAKTGNVAYDFSASDHPDWYKIGLAGFAIDDSGYQATGVLGVGYGSAISGIGGKFVGKGYSTVSAYGVDAKAVCNGGTNAIGVYIEDNSGAVNNYGIYQEGSNDKNYFAGNVGIGTTGPTHALEVITDVHGASPTFAPAGYFNNIHPEMSTGVYGEGFTRGVWGVSRANNGAGFGVVGEMGNGEGCSWAMEDTSGGAVVGITNCNSGDSGVAIRARHYNALSLAYGIYSEGIYSRNYFAGYVGIGTNNPTIKLAIGDTDTGLDWASDGNLKVMTNNSERIRITSDGKVGIGITNPTHTLQLGNDDAAKTTTTTWTTTSDGRLKNVVGTYDRGLAEIMRINPIRYTYKENNALGIVVPGVHIGIIAQDVQKVIPEAITVDSTGYLHYNGDPVIWASVNAIKEQQKEIDELKNIVCQLKPDADVCKK